MKHLAFLLIFGALGLSVSARNVYVDPAGNDQHPGTRAQPLATPAGALALLAARGDQTPEAWTIHMATGTWSIDAPLVLGPEHGGTKEAPVQFRGTPGGTVIRGGVTLPQPRVREDGLWTCPLPPGVLQRTSPVRQVFINDQRAVRAREPDHGYFHMQDVREKVIEPGDRVARKAQTRITMQTAERDVLRHLRPEDLKHTEWLAFHKWDNTRMPVQACDPDQGTLTSAGGGMKPWNPLRQGTRFRLDNFLAALDEPGEWFIDSGQLLYHARAGEQADRCEIVIPLAEQLLIVEGHPDGPVRHITFEGLTFEHSACVLDNNAFPAQQAAASLEAAILLDHAEEVCFRQCTLQHTGLHGIWFRQGCRDSGMEQCVVRDTGGGFARIGEMQQRGEDTPAWTGRITLHNNLLYSGGMEFPCAVGVWIGHSAYNQVTHNEIADLYYTGVSVGWRWGYSDSGAHHNQVRFNHIHHLGKGVLSDMGGVYTLGPSPGTSVSDNHMHDIYAYDYGGWGLYTDEGSSHILMENNLVHDVKTGGFHQHYGRENLVRNNILAYSKLHQLQATRVEDHLSFTFERNIVFWDAGPLLSGRWQEIQITMDHNLYWCTGGAFDFLGLDWTAWKARGHDTQAVITDPLFVQPDQRDFRFRSTESIDRIGFKPFDLTKPGLVGEDAWRARAGDIPLLPPETRPPQPPLSYHETFEDLQVGKPPPRLAISPRERPELVTVTDLQAATGKRSLKVVDGPDVQPSYNPHFYLNPHYTNGTTHCSFSLRLEPGCNGFLEWRDWPSGQAYRVGPHLDFRHDSLRLAGAEALPLPPDTWIRIHLQTDIAGASKTWSAVVDVPGKPSQRYTDLPYQHPDFQSLTWLGFCSTTLEKSAFYLDDVQVRVEP